MHVLQLMGLHLLAYLLQLLLRVYLPAPFVRCSLPKLTQAMGLLLGRVDFAPQLLLHLHLLHLNAALLLLSLLQPDRKMQHQFDTLSFCCHRNRLGLPHTLVT